LFGNRSLPANILLKPVVTFDPFSTDSGNFRRSHVVRELSAHFFFDAFTILLKKDRVNAFFAALYPVYPAPRLPPRSAGNPIEQTGIILFSLRRHFRPLKNFPRPYCRPSWAKQVTQERPSRKIDADIFLGREQ
jgi:hypothetical protein